MSAAPLAPSRFASGAPASSSAPTQQAAAGKHHASQQQQQPQPPFLHNAHLLYGQASLPGSRYGILNQDYVEAQQLHDSKHLRQHRWPQCYAAVVLDGHGMLGEQAAREAGRHIIAALQHSDLRRRQLANMSRSEVEQVVRAAFLAGHLAALCVFDDAPPTYIYPLGSRLQQRYTLHRQDNGDKAYFAPNSVGGRILEFGTTATLALVQGTTLVVASVGDSLAVLGWEAEDSYQAEIVSVRHWGYDEGERARLVRECGTSVSVSEQDGYLTVDDGRLRGFQLAMTRALGHRLLAQYGVASAPSVTFHQLRPEHLCLIVATDGVWEVLSPGAAVKLVADVVAEGRSAEEAALELCRRSVALASGDNTVRQARGAEADNTTAAVFVFNEL